MALTVEQGKSVLQLLRKNNHINIILFIDKCVSELSLNRNDVAAFINHCTNVARPILIQSIPGGSTGRDIYLSEAGSSYLDGQTIGMPHETTVKEIQNTKQAITDLHTEIKTISQDNKNENQKSTVISVSACVFAALAVIISICTTQLDTLIKVIVSGGVLLILGILLLFQLKGRKFPSRR